MSTVGITPERFVADWKGRNLTERAGSHAHFIQLCRLLGAPAPYDNPGEDESYCFDAITATAGSRVYAAARKAKSAPKRKRAASAPLFGDDPPGRGLAGPVGCGVIPERLESSADGMARPPQEQLPFDPVRNSELFTNHRLDRRLRDEPEWAAHRGAAAASGDTEAAFALLSPCMAEPPFPLAVRDVLVNLTGRIIPLETARGDIARTDRSRLCPDAQPYQDLIDRILFAAAGLSRTEAAALTSRLARML